MKILKLSFFAVSLFLLSHGIAQAQSVELFVAAKDNCVGQVSDTSGNLYRVNLTNATSDLIGPIGFLGLSALEFLGDGRLVGSASDDGPNKDPRRSILIDINPETGSGTLIGQIGNDDNDNECGRAPGLTYDSASNSLFATADSCFDMDDYLQTINQATGHGTLIGAYNPPFDGCGNGIAIRDDGVIFAAVCEELITVNPQTGAGTKVADLNTGVEPEFAIINALAFHPVTGDLYGTTVDSGSESPNKRSSTLVILDTTTGETTFIGDLPDCSDGLVFKIVPRNIPTLSEWGLIAMVALLGLAGLFFVAWRKCLTEPA